MVVDLRGFMIASAVDKTDTQRNGRSRTVDDLIDSLRYDRTKVYRRRIIVVEDWTEVPRG